jgi:hypothetical protein
MHERRNIANEHALAGVDHWCYESSKFLTTEGTENTEEVVSGSLRRESLSATQITNPANKKQPAPL